MRHYSQFLIYLVQQLVETLKRTKKIIYRLKVYYLLGKRIQVLKKCIVCFRKLSRANYYFLTKFIGVFAATVLRMHLCHRRKKLHLKYTPETLGLIKLCGIICSIIALSASIIYFVLMSVFKQGKTYFKIYFIL